MLKERKNYAAVRRHYAIKESSVRYIKEESTNFGTLREFNQKRNVIRCLNVIHKSIKLCCEELYSLNTK